jgi:tRNA nucleotidyltransferase (CCA-adding enzyme)
VARLPVPREELTGGFLAPFDARFALPAGVAEVAAALWAAGHDAHLVGGCVRDVLRGVEPADWDLATDAAPERMLELFPGALYENRFGTVVVPASGRLFEITTWRSEGTYTDHRRPDVVHPAASLRDDLARRDFTINAMALAVDATGIVHGDVPTALVDPFGGREDLAAGLIRAVGDPAERFREDALRMLRAVRFAATLGMTVEKGTLAAIGSQAALAAHVSGERIATELLKLLAADRPSLGLRPGEATGLLAVIAPELGRQRGIPQAKIPGDDLWDHTLRTVDAAPRPRSSPAAGPTPGTAAGPTPGTAAGPTPGTAAGPTPGTAAWTGAPGTPAGPPLLRLAALVHDIGKPATFADGHFLGHDTVGAEMAAAWLTSLHLAGAVVARVERLVRHHMFAYDPGWSDAAVRRFIRRVGSDAVEDQLDLRAADNVGSGQAPDARSLEELRARCREQLAAHVALDLAGLAVNGDDLMAALGMAPGPALGQLLDRLLERVIGDPMLNERSRLLALADELAAGPAGMGAMDEGDVGDGGEESGWR